nr:helical backbone metal receptor [Rhodocyclus gracilis]
MGARVGRRGATVGVQGVSGPAGVKRWATARACCARRVLAAAFCALVLAPALALAEIVLKDDRGSIVRLPEAPQRIVSLVPSLSESVCVLGACSRIVGTDRYSDYPQALQRVSKLGEITNPDLSALVALKPDIVLTSYVPRLAERLEAAGVKVLMLDLRTQADIRRALALLGRMLALPDPEAAWRTIDTRIERAGRTVPASMRGVSFYYEFDSSLFAAGEASFIGESLARFGVRNIVPPNLGFFPRLSPEFILRADPQVMMMVRRSAMGVPKRAGWQRIRAVRDQRVCWFSEEEADVLSRPGPRIGEAAEIMARCLRSAAAGPIPLPPQRTSPNKAVWP